MKALQRQSTLYSWSNTLRMLCLLAAMAVSEISTGNPFLGAFLFLSLYVVASALTSYPKALKGNDGEWPIPTAAARMHLFASVALELGVMMMFCFVLVSQTGAALWQKYLVLTLWMALMCVTMWLFSKWVKGRWIGLSLAEFVVGVVTWVIGDIFMLRTVGTLPGLVWNIVWALGIVLIYSALEGFTRDFETVAGATGGSRMSHRASIASAGIMLLVMVVWTMGAPLITDNHLPRLLNICVAQLPLLFMLVALVYAIKNPLDHRNREKLMLYIQSHTNNEKIRASLQRMLGGRVNFWARLLCWLVMPFLRHKVTGREYLRPAEYPSVFVCNHGFLYGPIVAALYLPTYFRPWIHDRMLDERKARREIELSFPWARKVFGRRLSTALVNFFARLVCRLLLSFRPIPVTRGSSHEALNTFDLSLEALEEGDNLLLFPEKPKRLADDASSDLRNLYTGFAHLGKIYYDTTGRTLMFYPIYSDHQRRTFSIGKPVAYDPSLPPRDSKRAIAEELQQRMENLMKNHDK